MPDWRSTPSKWCMLSKAMKNTPPCLGMWFECGFCFGARGVESSEAPDICASVVFAAAENNISPTIDMAMKDEIITDSFLTEHRLRGRHYLSRCPATQLPTTVSRRIRTDPPQLKVLP